MARHHPIPPGLNQQGESPPGTAIIAPSSATINASPTPGAPGSGNVFSIASTSGGQVAIGGVVTAPYQVTANVTELYYDSDHNIWQFGNGQWGGPMTASGPGAYPVSDPRPGFTVAAIPNETIGATFTVSGTILGHPVTAPTMQYRDDTGTWLPLPSGAIVTAGSPGVAGSFNFTHPSFGAAGSHTTSVRDANATSVTATSNAYSVGAASTSTIIWGLWGEGGTDAQANALVAAAWGGGTPQKFVSRECYIAQPGQGGWSGFASQLTDPTVGQVPAQTNWVTAAQGGYPMIAISPSASGSQDQTFKDILAGMHDTDINSIWAAYAAAGFTKMAVRPLWEFNVGGGITNQTNTQQQTDYLNAFAYIANLAHTNTSGITVKVIWNPGDGNYDQNSNGTNYGVAPAWYPGTPNLSVDTYVDWIGIDASAGYGNAGDYTSPLDLTINPDWQIGGCAAFAVQHGKPVAICEGGCAIITQDGLGHNFQTTLSGAITSGATSINVQTNNGRIVNGSIISIDIEFIHVGTASGTSLTGCTRGYNGTAAAAHSSGANVAVGGYTFWFSSILSALASTGGKLALFLPYDALNGIGSDLRWQTNQADINAMTAFMKAAPVFPNA